MYIFICLLTPCKDTVPLQVLCNGATQSQIYFEIYDYDKLKQDDFIGSASIQVIELLTKPNISLALQTKSAKKAGTLLLENIKVTLKK